MRPSTHHGRGSWIVRTALLCAVVALPAKAADEWVLTTADFQVERIALRGVDASGLRIQGADGRTRTISFDQMLQIDRVGPARSLPAGRFILSLRSGERFSGEPKGLEGEVLVWSNHTLGEVKAPLSRVSGIQRSQQASDRPDAAGSSAPAGRGTEDLLTLANGDIVRGIVTSITDNTVTIQSGGGDPMVVPLDSIAAVGFATLPQAGDGHGDPAGRAFRVSVSDSTTVAAATVKHQGDELIMTLGDNSSRTVPLSSVTSIEQINGPVVWLSSKAPVESVQTPFLDYAAPARMNRAVTGEPIQFGNRTYARGIGVHSYSRLVWEIDPSYQAFRTQYAIDGQLPYANVTVRIKLDDRVVHEQADFRAGVLSPLIVLETRGARRLTLEVDWGDTYDVQDRFNWIEPALLKEKPQPPAAAPRPATGPATSPATLPGP